MSNLLSVVIITKNEEEFIEDAIKSAQFADEVLVLDSYSSDDTVNIAKKLAVRLESQNFLGFGPQKNKAINIAKYDWVFVLDSDERISKKLRFDFSHNNPLEHDDLLKIESIINEQINSNSKVKTEILSYEKAVEKGALALFGEKYEDSVRVLSMGEDNFSIELCGGTHVDSLSEIGSFKLIAQSSVASGIRRLEAVTGSMADTSEALIEKILTQKKAKEDKKSNRTSNRR